MVGARFFQILYMNGKGERAARGTGTGVTIAVQVDAFENLLSRGLLAVVELAQLRCRKKMMVGYERGCVDKAPVCEVMPVDNLRAISVSGQPTTQGAQSRCMQKRGNVHLPQLLLGSCAESHSGAPFSSGHSHSLFTAFNRRAAHLHADAMAIPVQTPSSMPSRAVGRRNKHGPNDTAKVKGTQVNDSGRKTASRSMFHCENKPSYHDVPAVAATLGSLGLQVCS